VRKAVEDAKKRGKTVVFTNGCFDILHIGHIRYLQDARALGDLLVVGVNGDESVRKLKGPERPVVPEFERVEMLAALECVDYVTLFTQDTPVELIRTIKPSIHVKGGDYVPEDLPEAAAVREVGARIEIVAYTSTDTEGLSTTSLIGKIVSSHGQQ
jgi:rfaE bifunctional protein nucleotidyltransferase chain/domain